MVFERVPGEEDPALPVDDASRYFKGDIQRQVISVLCCVSSSQSHQPKWPKMECSLLLRWSPGPAQHQIVDLHLRHGTAALFIELFDAS
ncbi:hypothetical protein DAPPUDRAFT_260969 [Daphnia pulex]|uniref:Uncharacterized protein n=1 Tax=Daphnia pulex TaxID=6669 RepID=E9HK89_DAPPU|nr:hypothetical protein DAPPUDRAFT_260969 [Daphnia pulex]|eukprot:EFX67839.1 hypothetical protein DAPPUDRAFT_260969 [Daphnia pulex]